MSTPGHPDRSTIVTQRATGIARAILVGAYAVLWLGGVVTYTVGGRASVRGSLIAPVFLWLALAIVLVAVPRRYAERILLAGAIGWAAEVLGANTGVPFGAYTYADELGAKLWGAPLVIGSAWAVLGVSAAGVTRAVPHVAWSTVCAAIWLVAVDLVLDPVASGPLGFWAWRNASGFHGVPLTNFAGWFLVGVAVCSLLRGVEIGPAAGAVGVSLVLFFSTIALAQGLQAPGGIGLALVVLSAAALAARGRAGAAGR